MLVLIDNYDSFTYNLVHYLGELGARCEVFRNDKISVAEVLKLAPKGIVLSPGPCTPNEAGICLELIEKAGPSIPLLGVCLGHQAIGQVYGGKVIRAPVLMHGKLSKIANKGQGVFKGLPKKFEVTRYHSLIVERASLPESLAVTAETAQSEGGLIMGLQHKTHPVHGVQFHPESIASEHGHALLANFLEIAGMSPRRRNARPSATPPESPRAPQRAPMDAQPSQELRALIQKVSGGATLTEDEIRTALDQMTAGAATPAQMGAFLMALRVRGETVEEITGAAQMLRSRMNRVEVPPDAIDIVGTGGDSHGTYNISTCAALVAAGAGVKIAKHGNRRVSSKSGASDVLAELGVKLDVPFDTISRCVAEAGLGFLWAPQHHPAMKHWAADPRRARHPHHLQPAGADLQSRRRQAPGGGRVLLALGGADRPRAEEPRRPARVGGARPRRPRRAHHHGRHRRGRAEERQDRGVRGDAGRCRPRRPPSSPTSRAATRRRTPPPSARCWPASARPCATSPCSTPPPP